MTNILFFVMAKKDEEQEKSATLEDFYIDEKVQAFCDKYRHVKEQTFASEVFNEEKLREFFKAYVIPSHGDPLKIYITELRYRGYEMSVSLSGELAIIVEEKF